MPWNLTALSPRRFTWTWPVASDESAAASRARCAVKPTVSPAPVGWRKSKNACPPPVALSRFGPVFGAATAIAGTAASTPTATTNPNLGIICLSPRPFLARRETNDGPRENLRLDPDRLVGNRRQVTRLVGRSRDDLAGDDGGVFAYPVQER